MLLYVICEAPEVLPGQDVIWLEHRYIYKGFATVEVETINDSSVCYPFSVPAGSLIDEYCQGTTHVRVYHNGEGGVYTTEDEFSDACGFVAAITIVEVRLTHESQEGLADGIAEVIAISDAPRGLEYSLDDFLTSQGSNIFANLAPGTYTVWVRDRDLTNKVSAVFTIRPGDSGNPKYRHHFINQLGQAVEMNIYLQGWDGGTTDLTCSVPAILISKGSQGGDKYDPIKSTRAQMNVIAFTDYAYQEFFKADEKDYRLEVIVAGKLRFKGFILPDVYSEPYKHTPYPVSLQASDGLELLKKSPLTHETGAEIVGEKTVFEFIVAILNKLELNLPIISHLNTWEQSMNLDIDPLKQAVIHSDAFVRGGEAMDAYAALEAIMTAWNCRLYQEEGAWHIVPVNVAGNTRTVRRFDMNGELEGEETIDPVIRITPPRAENALHWVEGSQHLDFRPAAKEVLTTYQTGGVLNYIPGGTFEDHAWQDGQLKGWDGSAVYVKTESSARGSSNDLHIRGSAQSLAYATVLRSPTFFMDVVPDGFVNIYRLDAWIKVERDAEGSLEWPARQNPQLYWELKCGEYYYDWDAERNPSPNKPIWTLTRTFNNLITTDNTFRFNEYQRSADYYIGSPPFAGMATIRIYQAVSPDYNITGVKIARLVLYRAFSGQMAFEFPAELTASIKSVRRLSEKHEATILMGDEGRGSDRENAGGSALMKGTIRVGGRFDFLQWNGQTFRMHHAAERSKNYGSAFHVLTGSLRGELGFDKVLYDPFLPGRYFMCTGYEYNVARGTYLGEWMEIWTGRSKGYLIDLKGNYARDKQGNRILNK